LPCPASRRKETKEIEPWQENGETWRRLKVTFPASIATHSAEQTFYFDQEGLLTRHDYELIFWEELLPRIMYRNWKSSRESWCRPGTGFLDVSRMGKCRLRWWFRLISAKSNSAKRQTRVRQDLGKRLPTRKLAPSIKSLALVLA
jgi:hypothetical protein